MQQLEAETCARACHCAFLHATNILLIQSGRSTCAWWHARLACPGARTTERKCFAHVMLHSAGALARDVTIRCLLAFQGISSHISWGPFS